MENGGSCLKDYIIMEFSDGKSSRICGYRPIRKPFLGPGPVKVTFASDAKTEYRGFYLQYQGWWIEFMF